MPTRFWVPSAHRLVSGTGASDHPCARRHAGDRPDRQQQVDSTLIFVDVNTVLLGALFLVALWALVRTPAGRPWDAMMLAASPCVAAAALINWDMRRWP